MEIHTLYRWNKERLLSGTGERRYGQQLYPKFYNDSRATTANTTAVRRREMSKLSKTFIRNKNKTKLRELEISEWAIQSEKYQSAPFKEYLGKPIIIIFI